MIKLETWLRAAQPDESLVYHEGVIATDAEKSLVVKSVRDRVNELVDQREVTVLHEAAGEGRWKYRVVRLAAKVAALLLLAAPVQAHDWYGELKQPGSAVSCCSDRDCQPVEGCIQDGREGLRIQGQCRAIPWDKVLPVSSPDGGRHACWDYVNGQPKILCAVLPGAS